MAWASAIAGSLGSIWGCCQLAGLLGICWPVQSLQQATWTAGGAGGWDRGVGWDGGYKRSDQAASICG